MVVLVVVDGSALLADLLHLDKVSQVVQVRLLLITAAEAAVELEQSAAMVQQQSAAQAVTDLQLIHLGVLQLLQVKT
jgi:hypothetical protein